MYQYQGLNDTIVAIATPSGVGGIGIIRLSGKDAIAIADQMFKPKGQTQLADAPSHTMHYGFIMNDQEVVDEVMVSVMKAPRSYTTEDVVEINSHGGHVPVKAVLQQALDLGARLAEPGEFTKRAFVHGRIDLPQAEAVLDMIHAKTETFLRVSHHQLKGELSTKLISIRDALMVLYTEIEAIVNFPEDEIDARQRNELRERLKQEYEHVHQLLQSSHNGRLLKEGIRLVLCGKPNVGKSSLLNVLLKEQRAIVTDVAGTTRDVIEESAQIQGVPFQIVDTAGILEPRDLVEEEAIKRSHLYIQGADVILLVLDQSRDLEQADLDLIEKLKDQRVIVLMNKSDLNSVFHSKDIAKLLPDAPILSISALEQKGIQELEQSILKEVWQGDDMNHHGLMMTNIRHVQSLRKAHDLLVNGLAIMDEGTSWEFISEEIKLAINCLDAITGRNIDHDLLETIFSSFCIGK